MSFRLLSFLFKIGHVFGLTPSSLHVPKISLFKKFYYLLIFVILMYGVSSKRIINLQTKSREMILLYIISTTAFVGQNSAFLLRSLIKRKSWINFLRNLELTARLTRVRTSTK
ncbi:hypothetical protein Zmor_018929 [Zophobas morio]|uniref:Uncharacterized protein n=1 Tax=Zophobas morio TaxID=2755281 RepID=A0AA38IFL0_9CUCU|nr:hypothetical protein Zmor_018929 [Zophobas morio]